MMPPASLASSIGLAPSPTPSPNPLPNPSPSNPPTSSPNPNSSPATSDEILNTVPTPIIRLLVIFGRPIYRFKKGLEVLMWRTGKSSESWLVVGSWCALCLCGRAVWIYLLPPLLLLPFIPLPSTPTLLPPSVHLQPPLIPPTPSSSTPATSQTILLTLSHLHAINGMIPNDLIPKEWRKRAGRWREMEARRVVRGMGVCWIVWIGLNWLMGGRVTLLLIGAAILLSPSPLLHAFIQLLRKSLFVRRLATLTFLLVFGSPPADTPPKGEVAAVAVESDVTGPKDTFSVSSWMHKKWTTSRRPSFAFRLRPKEGINSFALSGSAVADDPSTENQDDAPAPSPPVYFRFELQENQRWWMGLDWTSALLPQERPAWCDVYLNPASPPSSFTLPPESVMYLPEPRQGDPNGKTKRTARWRWIDEDWSVVKRSGDGKSSMGSGAITTGINNPPTAQQHVRSGSISSHTEETGHPSHDDQPKSKGLAEQAFLKGMEKLKQRTLAGGAAPAASGPVSKGRPMSGDYSEAESKDAGLLGSRRRTSSGASDLTNLLGGNNASSLAYGPNAAVAAAALQDLDAGTDAEGWSYGDNKWEGMGAKGGMGRYTRRRRWQRRAVCSEVVEFISGVGVARTESDGDVDDLPVESGLKESDSAIDLPSGTIRTLPSTVPAHGLRISSGVTGYALEGAATPSLAEAQTTVLAGGDRIAGKSRTESVSANDRDHALRQRLRSAMGSVGG